MERAEQRREKIKDEEGKSISGIQISLRQCAPSEGEKRHNVHMLIHIMAKQSNYQKKKPGLSL